MNFELEEKLAIIRVLEKVAKADNKLVEEEMQILLKVAKFLGINEGHIQASKDMTIHEAGEIIRTMDHEKIAFINSTLLNLMASDGAIDIIEVQTLLDVFFGEDKK